MMTRILAFCLTVLTFVVSLDGQEKYRVYFGTYTGQGSKGIYHCEMDLKDGSLSKPELSVVTESPSFIAFHPTKPYVYAVNESIAKISSFVIDRQTGKLKFLNSQPSQGGAPCHLVVDPTGKNVLAANYTGGSCICIPLESDGKLASKSSFQQHQGKRIHGHSIHVDQSNKYALCCDLGLDQVLIYRFDANQGTLKSHAKFELPQGSGPRHFAWNADGKTAYINGESNMTVVVSEFDAKTGSMKQKQVLSTLPKDVTPQGGSTAEVVVHPSGKFVYVSNRDPYNSIAIFKVNPETKELSPVGHQSQGIKTPRNFAIEPTGRFMLVANQSGGNVIVFEIDQESGKLRPTEHRLKIDRAVCVRFVKLRQD